MTPRTRFTLEWATVSVLWRRDVRRFFLQRSRVVGALVQPVLFFFVIGRGFASSFQAPGAEGLDYRSFFFPGVVAMVLLFSSLYATISVIEDRRQGFLRTVLAGPGSRGAVVLGKCAGALTIALVQAGLFLLLAPVAGVVAAKVAWLQVALVMVLTALGLAGVGFTLAWVLDSQPAYLAIMSVVLIPAWVLSGGLFPLKGTGLMLEALAEVNPLRFAVDALRRALFGPALVAKLGGAASGVGDLLGLVVFAFIALALAATVMRRRR